MAAIRTLLMLLGALGVLLLGAVSPAYAQDGAPPCHEMAGSHAPAGKTPTERALKSMACCVACIASPNMTPPLAAASGTVRTLPRPTPTPAPGGRRPCPETGPPKA